MILHFKETQYDENHPTLLTPFEEKMLCTKYILHFKIIIYLSQK